LAQVAMLDQIWTKENIISLRTIQLTVI
jgi:hypothetical protein